MDEKESPTVFLTREVALKAGLTETEADILADRTEKNSEAVERFEALEKQIAESDARQEKFLKWLGTIGLALFLNYASNIYDWLTR